MLTGAGRGIRLTERTARKLPREAEVREFDVTSAEQADNLREHLSSTWGRVAGALHAIGFAPEICLGEDFMAAEWPDVAVAMEISAYSLKTVAEVVAPLLHVVQRAASATEFSDDDDERLIDQPSSVLVLGRLQIVEQSGESDVELDVLRILTA